MDTHEYYEELCALAASGQASETELADLRAHLENCATCRGVAYDFSQLSAQALSVLAAKRLNCEIPSGMSERFVARARSEGIEISRKPATVLAKRKRLVLGWATSVVAAAILIAALLTLSKAHPSLGGRAQKPPATRQLSEASAVVASHAAPAQGSDLQRQLGSAKAEIGTLTAVIKAQGQEIDAVRHERNALGDRLAGAEQQDSNLQSEKAQWEARIAQLEAELEKTRSEKNASDAALTLQDAELKELRRKVADQDESLARQQELVVKGSDVRDLVVARNLHIIDVHDRDGNGRSQRAFGRIFYTEGKSLIFYAYDLSDPVKVEAKVSFYVWGEHLGAEKPIASLGVLHSDDTQDGRWVLTFDDPRILAQIDSVFVTAEPNRKVVREPGGKRLLFAFLGDKPNHP